MNYRIDLDTVRVKSTMGDKWAASGRVWARTKVSESRKPPVFMESLHAEYHSTSWNTEQEAIKEVLGSLGNMAHRIGGGR